MKERLPGSCISHVKWISRLNRGIFYKIEFRKLIDSLYSYFCWDVAGFEFAEELVNQHAVTHFQCYLGEILMGPVHWVPELKGGNPAPPFFFKHLPCLCWRQE